MKKHVYFEVKGKGGIGFRFPEDERFYWYLETGERETVVDSFSWGYKESFGLRDGLYRFQLIAKESRNKVDFDFGIGDGVAEVLSVTETYGSMEAFKPELGKQKLEEVLNEKAFN